MSDRIRRSINTLFESYSRRLGKEGENKWADAFGGYDEHRVLRVLDQACELGEFPTLGVVLSMVRGRQDQKAAPDHKPLSIAEQQRSARSATLSALWLHYKYGTALTELVQTPFGVAFGQIMEAKTHADRVKILAAAKEDYSEEIVFRWMEDQIRIGN